MSETTLLCNALPITACNSGVYQPAESPWAVVTLKGGLRYGARMFVDRVVSMLRLFTLIHRTLRHKPTSAYTLGDLIEARAAAQPRRPFLLFEDRRISYADFNAAANRVAHWGHAHGLRVGDRVALLMQNRPEYLYAWGGLAKLGVVVPLINPNLRGDMLR